ncbi:glutathione S-transferase family protein [Pseudorhodoferax sp. Leaf267]|uniref:glutathione S-transferase family protein n=1 Tax=Pseudorhodoferax sp. Leaf267 TaxID=1736316 RepID=UPI0006F6330D|nr:glutathione S-transferase family protein [Pseudorhodoferax sp. Leaf267]KQP15176.1 glutathione S-transferase [Pseudorhodoferax sp. Leaf267]
MITVTGMKWAPPFPEGMVRDMRVRWILNEVGWPYRVVLLDAPGLKSAAHRAKQPFGQLPVLEEDGQPPLFESGAIVIYVASRAERCIAADRTPERLQALQWSFAALNTVEPSLFAVAEVECLTDDDVVRQRRRPVVVAAAHERLGDLARALGDRPWFVGDDFTVADLLMASVLELAVRLDLLDAYPSLAVWQRTMFDRPGHRQAEADQRTEMQAHSSADMRLDAVPKESP